MSMIVARMQKMKAENLVGIGNHNQRKTKNHSNPDIDTSLSKLNYDLVDRTQNYKTDIENFINENKTTTRAVRKDAVLVNEWIISSDKDFFDNLTESEIENFFERSKDYFAEKFGEKNIRYATVHLDESTPHMHMGIVPFDKDNKLSAKRVFNRQALRDVQEELPKY
ncbi:TPA: plasmid recombination protein, partial [Enterococcus faecalis]|nr:plasmid recombination protein [Enterococcus faecalis]